MGDAAKLIRLRAEISVHHRKLKIGLYSAVPADREPPGPPAQLFPSPIRGFEINPQQGFTT
jgi:hypothetical protein